MKWILLVAGIFALLILIVLILGLLQPVKHSITRSIRLNQKPETVFSVLDNSADLPNWSSGIARVERLPDRGGKPVIRCQVKWGRLQMILTQLENTPPTRLVTAMSKENGTTLGTWTYQIAADAGGCRVALTEDGEIKNPFFRLMARMHGLDANITQTLRDLAKRFGETAEIRASP
jgi:hypothetical protein